ncbi:hypothetical protein [Butyrivibrio sp. VCB2006]|uniref:hypothetical protein n=1 Tax=Butyrivibrio sp. VCB2006 TaxID=1280679 RepID=UPI000420757C|nr:hypothetical protein [Butyrivibrio sp. VCB2006]
MNNTRKWAIAFLVSVLFTCSMFAGKAVYSKSQGTGNRDLGDLVQSDVVYTLNGYLGLDENADAEGNKADSSGHDVDGMGRLTQRVTIVSDGNVLPISGTVTKMQDAYYPGTYEVKFGNKAILTTQASVHVKIDVDKNEQVYILTGDKDKGYTQVDVVTADSDNCVVFDTNIIQDYTISKTDIISAQAAMASVLTN